MPRAGAAGHGGRTTAAVQTHQAHDHLRQVTYVELYQEQVQDLLATGPPLTFTTGGLGSASPMPGTPYGSGALSALLGSTGGGTGGGAGGGGGGGCGGGVVIREAPNGEIVLEGATEVYVRDEVRRVACLADGLLSKGRSGVGARGLGARQAAREGGPGVVAIVWASSRWRSARAVLVLFGPTHAQHWPLLAILVCACACVCLVVCAVSDLGSGQRGTALRVRPGPLIHQVPLS